MLFLLFFAAFVLASVDRYTHSALHEPGVSLIVPPHVSRHYDNKILLQRTTIDAAARPADVGAKERDAHIRQLRALSSLSLPSSLVTAPQTTSLHQYLVHLKMPLTSTIRQKVNEFIEPYRLGQYLPHNSFLVVGPDSEDFVLKLSRAPSVLHVSHYDAVLKISFSLERHAQMLSLQSSSSSILLLIHIGEEYYASVYDLSVALSQWSDMLRAAGISGVDLVAKLPYLATATVETSALPHALAFFAHRKEVRWVEKSPKFVTQNKYARYVIQSNHYNMTDVWSKGIEGNGEVVVVADTGVDFDSCYFHDPKRPVPVGRVDFTHRKIVLYESTWGDAGDDVGGHGSHVSGSVLGEVIHDNITTEKIMGEYNGMAPKAKLAFYDFKTSLERELTVPVELYSNMFQDAYSRVSARIASMSWGSDDGEYSHYCREIDKFLWDQKEFITVFAAGNYGERGHFTISTPGISKNPLTVGACKSSSESFYDLGQQAGFEIVFPSALKGSYQVSPANFGVHFKEMSNLNDVLVETASPPDACSQIQQAKGKIILVRRGVCYFTQKARNVRLAGGVMMMLVNSDDAPAEVMGGEATGDDANFTSVMITKALGEQMWGVAERAGKTKEEECRVSAPREFASEELSENNMAGFSSTGPTKDMRLKPDVVGPGMYIVSVRSDGDPRSFTCNKKDSLVSMEGTSMATPIVAGAVTLAREYFIKGFYPSGVANRDDELTPSGALLKAMMIASATTVQGVVHLQTPGKPNRAVRPAPSPDQGYGRVLLDAILYFNESSKFRVFVSDQEELPNLGMRSFCFRAFSEGGDSRLPPFRATLSWTDPPSSPIAALHMVNDLDLFVTIPNTTHIFLGNNLSFVDKEGVLHTFWDSNTNVERVSLAAEDMQGASLFGVHVRGTHIPAEDGQPFALVVNGNIERVDVSLCAGEVVCPGNCWANLLRGECSEYGTCKCHGDYFGSDCGQQMREMPRDSSSPAYWQVSSKSAVLVWEQYWIDVTSEHLNWAGGLEINMEVTPESKGDPDIYITAPNQGVPSLSNFQWAGTSCEPCGQTTTVNIPGNELVVGRYGIGVFGYCCEGAEYKLTVSKPSITRRIIRWLTIVGFVLLGVCAFSCIVWLCKRRQRKKQGFTAVGVTSESLELVQTNRDIPEDEFTDLVYDSDETDEK